MKDKETKVQDDQKAPGAAENLPATQGGALMQVDFGDDAGRGLEDVKADELRIPFLVPLATNSPQVKPIQAGGIPGAKAGQLFNTGTGELFDSPPGLTILPCGRDHNFVEFTPRILGGGFVAVYPPGDPKIEALRAKQGRFGRLTTTTRWNEKQEPLDGTEITETFYLYALVIGPDGLPFRAAIPFKSTQIRKYQAFMGRATGFKYANPRSTAENPLPAVVPPLWAHRWNLQTIFEKNKKGEYYGWQLRLAVQKEN